MTYYLVIVERALSDTEILQHSVTEADTTEGAVQNFRDYYSDFWGQDTEESDYHETGYVRPDGAEYVTLDSVEEVNESAYETLATYTREL